MPRDRVVILETADGGVWSLAGTLVVLESARTGRAVRIELGV